MYYTTGEGLLIHIEENEKRMFFGSIAAISADNLGSQALGGFKESRKDVSAMYGNYRHSKNSDETR